MNFIRRGNNILVNLDKVIFIDILPCKDGAVIQFVYEIDFAGRPKKTITFHYESMQQAEEALKNIELIANL